MTGFAGPALPITLFLRPLFSFSANFAGLVGLLLLALAVVAAYLGVHSVNETLFDERQARRVVASIEGLQASLKEIEVIERQYAATPDPTLVARFDVLAAKVRSTALDVERRAQAGALRTALGELRVAIGERADGALQVMEARRTGGADAAATRLAAPERAVLAGTLERLLEQVAVRERLLLVERETASTDDLHFLERAMVVGILFAVALLGWALRQGHLRETARLAAEAALQARSRELRLLVDAVPAMIARVDADERYLMHNRPYAEWLGVPSARIDGRPVREVLGDDAYAVARPYIARALAGEAVQYERSFRNPGDPEGEYREVSVAYVPYLSSAGQTQGYYAMLTDLGPQRRLARMRSQFLAMVSHEMRTPVTTINGALELVAGGSAGALPAEAKPLVDMAHGAGQRLLRLLDDLLEIEALEQGDLPLQWREATVGEILAKARGRVEALAGAKGVKLVEGPVPEGRLHTDPDRVAEVVGHFLDNAVQFGPEWSSIEFGAEAQGDRLRFFVRDHGPGVSEAFRPRLFQKFAQDPSVARGRTGRFGLGLAAARLLVERLGGRIGYDPAPGGGALFWFDLPALPAA